MIGDLQQFIKILRREGELREITVEVNPYLEAAEIHRRVIAEGGPALLFTNIKGSPFPLVTNLFGTKRRIDLSFGKRPEQVIKAAVDLVRSQPLGLGQLWQSRSTIFDLLRVGIKRRGAAGLGNVIESPPNLDTLPLLTTWQQDGGPFVTLPLVYTQHPELAVSNLGMYRVQRFDSQTTGLHCQIGKGGGFHLDAARKLGQKLPVNIHIGGPPALILAAIAPLPENVPEVLLASLIIGKKITLRSNKFSSLPSISSAEFTLIGEVDPNESRPEGPFGDHYGYYSLTHDYPVFRCKAVIRRRNPICTATVVGKPKQEDFFLGDYLQELLSPLFPLVMPTVNDLWSYGETGYHSLASAVVKQRYKRESLVSAFRILGEGQLSLTKFLLLVDRHMDLKDFRSVLEYVLARADFRTDLYVFSNLAMDTLDYTGPKVNEGSKGVLLGVGDPIRELPVTFNGSSPQGVKDVRVFCSGCLVVSGASYSNDPNFGQYLLKTSAFDQWPLVVLVDDVPNALKSQSDFLWTTFTRFEPGGDIWAKAKEIVRNHVSYTPPILIDARKKPNLPEELVCDRDTNKLVDQRWREYFPDKS